MPMNVPELNIPSINPIDIITSVLQWIWNLCQEIFNYIWGAVDFGILWRWLPADIQAACSALLVIFFILALWRLLKSLLPFV